MRDTVKKAFKHFMHELFIGLYIYSALFWLVSLCARIFFNSPTVTVFFNDTALPITMSVVVVALIHWVIVYRKFIKNYPDNYKEEK